ncbi:Vi polysaccharide biosynthesis UDP-N-acetylglucosamine C-6 dehydrogenase TviB, partial [Acinetobacter baumannii]
LASIQKIVASKTSEGRAVIKYVYESIITAGIYEAPSIKVAEAAKAVENAQRDINISFMNELALMFHKMNIDVHEVLKAAATKWNFIPFKPGL